MVLKQVHDTNMRAKGHPERVFSVSRSPPDSDLCALQPQPLPGPSLSTPDLRPHSTIRRFSGYHIHPLLPILLMQGKLRHLVEGGKHRMCDCPPLLLTPGNPH